MAYGKIKADTIVYDNGGSDVEKTVASLAAAAPTADPTFTGTATFNNLTVNGTTTTINSTTLTVDDKNIELGTVDTPSDTTADGGGITLKGATDKTITWTNSTDTWDFNQGIKTTGGITASGSSEFTEDVKFDGATAGRDITFDRSDNQLEFEDNAKAAFGTGGDDMQIYSDGNNPIIYTGTNTLRVVADNIHLEAGDFGDEFLRCNHDGSVELYHDNTKRIETTAAGVTVTGTVTDSKGNLRSIPYQDETGSTHTLIATDAGKTVGANNTVEIPASVLGAGDAVTIICHSGTAITLEQGTGLTLYNSADGNTGDRSLAARGMATIYFVSGTIAYISGAGVS